MPHPIKPRLIVKPDGFHDEHIAVPLPARITHKSGLRIFYRPTAIKKDLTIDGTLLVKNQNQSRRLDDLDWKRNTIKHRHSSRLTVRGRDVFTSTREPLLQQ